MIHFWRGKIVLLLFVILLLSSCEWLDEAGRENLMEAKEAAGGNFSTYTDDILTFDYPAYLEIKEDKDFNLKKSFILTLQRFLV